MKILKFNLLLIALVAITFSLSSCGGGNSADDGHDDHSDDKMEMNDTDAGHDHSDDQEEHKADMDMGADMDHDHTYACPMHPEITGKDGEKCSKCGMDLKLVEADEADDHDH